MPKKDKYLYGNELTVGELKKLLVDVPDDMIVGRVGHFGEVNTLSEGDIRVIKTDGNYPYMTPTSGSWRSGKRKPVDILSIEVPDIGPDPD